MRFSLTTKWICGKLFKDILRINFMSCYSCESGNSGAIFSFEQQVIMLPHIALARIRISEVVPQPGYTE